jgi:carboxymethylenebutenolidase
MGVAIKLKASDGFELSAYRADPATAPRGGVVVIQEIFGVNSHIRSICDRLAAYGYAACAPAVFDRIKPGFETGYSAEDVALARELAGKRDMAKVMLDTAAAFDNLAGTGKIGITGFCMGGSVAFMAAARIPGLAAASGFYGGQIVPVMHEKPLCPTELHFGETDTSIPLTDVEKIKAARPDVTVYIYPAGHGFNCDERASFHAPSAKLAWDRTLALFQREIG